MSTVLKVETVEGDKLVEKQVFFYTVKGMYEIITIQQEALQKLERNIASMIEVGMDYAEVKTILNRKSIIRALPRRRERIAAEKAT